MKRLVLGILGAVLGLVGVGLLGAGAVVLGLFGTDGRAEVPIGAVTSQAGRAVVVTDFEISSDTPLPVDEQWFDLQLEVRGQERLFVGVAPKTDVLAYLQGVPYDLVTGIDSSQDTVNQTSIPGDRVPEAPADQGFWVDQESGRDVVVSWPVSDTDTTLVVMNEDASRAVSGDVSVLATISWAGSAAIGSVIAGLVVLVLAIVVLVWAFRSGSSQPAYPPGA
ncbi:MAG: hypothetical protein H6526_07780 [Actinobacteria bacterium]|nr:hypothetical protein [Actinomycetota bacterium]MCB8995872.1 hypothetical protein [Actinomycetota bacterium]MCB9415168.1 hypothetical protein [Actinomycetota bacterium]MCB9424589.1 hypothetical protein [Actinomycetota bacterium]HRY08479.1 hypothetical protein [Candidatus Nanopelagicales bacterium]